MRSAFLIMANLDEPVMYLNDDSLHGIRWRGKVVRTWNTRGTLTLESIFFAMGGLVKLCSGAAMAQSCLRGV